MEEIWKDCIGWEGLYMVSNLGNVKALAKTVKYSDGRVYNYKEKLLKKSLSSGYPTVHFYSLNGGRVTWLVHRLVAVNFIPNPNQKITVNHIDGVKTNNKVSNLEWATYQENNSHAINTGLHKGTPSKLESKLSKVNKEGVIDILKNYRKRVSGSDATFFSNKYGVTKTCIYNILKRFTLEELIE